MQAETGNEQATNGNEMATAKKTTYGEQIKAMHSGGFVNIESRLAQGGALQARKTKTGAVQLYWRYSHEGKQTRTSIGFYDSTAKPKQLGPTAKGYGIAAALATCAELARTHAERAATGGLREHQVEIQKEFKQRKAIEAESQTRTLAKLLGAYVDHLKAQERRSFYDADQIFRLHVQAAWPEIWGTPAADVTPDHVLDMLRRLIEQGKGRTANKLRAYMRAAYQCAIDVRTTASVPIVFKAFAVVFNPAAQTKREAKYDRADKRPLTAAELRAYWLRIKGHPGLPGAALRLHLLCGGQRIEQIVRLRWADVTDESLLIFDGKGRPGQGPRPHMLPLLDQVATTLEALHQVGEYVISTTEGKKPVSASTLGNWAREAVGEAINEFQLKRVRSGVETLLAANGVSREIRGHLQSHGLTGVQARHYDGHDYMPEKRRALELLAAELERKGTDKVVPIKRAGSGGS